MKTKRSFVRSFRSEGKRIPFVPITYTPLPVREERLSQHANRCAMSGRILDAEQNWYNTAVILILSAHISQTRISWLHNGCRTDGVTGYIQRCKLCPASNRSRFTQTLRVCVCARVSKLISRNLRLFLRKLLRCIGVCCAEGNRCKSV